MEKSNSYKGNYDILIDDSGWGSPLGGVVMGVYKFDTRQRSRQHQVAQRPQVNLLQRDHELRINRLQQHKVQVPRPDQLAEVRAVRHEERLDQRVDHHPRRQEHVKLVLRPAIDRRNPAENNPEQRQLRRKPERPRQRPNQEIPPETHLPAQRIIQKRPQHT